MQIKKAAMAGTLESSDAQVTVEPGNGSVELSIESSDSPVWIPWLCWFCYSVTFRFRCIPFSW